MSAPFTVTNAEGVAAVHEARRARKRQREIEGETEVERDDSMGERECDALENAYEKAMGW